MGRLRNGRFYSVSAGHVLSDYVDRQNTSLTADAVDADPSLHSARISVDLTFSQDGGERTRVGQARYQVRGEQGGDNRGYDGNPRQHEYRLSRVREEAALSLLLFLLLVVDGSHGSHRLRLADLRARATRERGRSEVAVGPPARVLTAATRHRRRTKATSSRTITRSPTKAREEPREMRTQGHHNFQRFIFRLVLPGRGLRFAIRGAIPTRVHVVNSRGILKATC